MSVHKRLPQVDELKAVFFIQFVHFLARLMLMNTTQNLEKKAMMKQILIFPREAIE